MNVRTIHMAADGSVSIKVMELPQLNEGDVLLKTTFSEVCGTDIHLSHGRLEVPFPIIPGHVSTGVIEQVNGEVSDVDGNLLQVGDRVTFLDVAERSAPKITNQYSNFLSNTHISR